MKKPAVIQVVGYKNTGKTTLICRMIEGLREMGLRVGTIKHDAHQFEMDHTDTDTWKHRQAGAVAVAITSEQRTAYIEEQHVPLTELLQRFEHEVDIVIVEGFKEENFPKMVMIQSIEHLRLMDSLKHVVGIVSWEPLSSHIAVQQGLPCYVSDDVEPMLDWLTSKFRLN